MKVKVEKWSKIKRLCKKCRHTLLRKEGPYPQPIKCEYCGNKEEE